MTLVAGAEDHSSTDEQSGSFTNQSTFRAEVRTVGSRGFHTSRCAFVTIDGSKFSFLLPEGCRANISVEDRVIVSKEDLTCSVSLRKIIGDAATTDPEKQRGALLNRYPDLELKEESDFSATKFKGRAYDFVHRADGLLRKTRVVFLATPVGVLEFKMSADPKQFDAQMTIFNQILRTFTGSKPNGEADVVLLPLDS